MMKLLLLYQPASQRKRVAFLLLFLAITLMDGLNRKNVVPFERHFDEKSKQSEDHLFLAAVEEALFEVKKRSALGLTCKCLNPSNFRPTEVEGFLEVDVAGYGARRNQYLKNPMRPIPRSLRHKLRTGNIMLMFHMARKTRSRECRRFGNHGEAFSFCIYTRCHKHLFGFLLAFSCARPQLEELEGSPQYPRSSDPLKSDDIAKQAKLKVPEIGIQNESLRKNVSQKKDNSMPQLRIFDSDDLSRSNKKRSSPDVQEDTITNKQKKGKTIDSMVARKKVVDNQYSDLRGDQISTKTTVVANHEERSTEQIESLIEDTEQTVMTIFFILQECRLCNM
ncbi:UNVERIFIED_CONTAM: hypothetical protein Sradi_2546900 [Sesamum radiatum]|uniref:Uncharacterized protein n=1 Tax=Sesamum radiatum TaxID=300843 RepID=A0AAW2SNE9_SESRA